MKRYYCDFCEHEIEGIGGASVVDQETYLSGIKQGNSIIVRIDLRNKGGGERLNRPDICGACRDKAVAQALGLPLLAAQAATTQNVE